MLKNSILSDSYIYYYSEFGLQLTVSGKCSWCKRPPAVLARVFAMFLAYFNVPVIPL